MESRRHAIVIGGSLAGLLAARALSDHFEHITVIERDRFPDSPAARSGVPQGRHLHVLWEHGITLLDALLPGLIADLCEAGAPELRIPADVMWLTSAGWRRRFDSARMLTFSRGLLDAKVVERIRSRVHIRPLHEVVGLLPRRGPGGRTDVAGVVLRERGSTGRGEPLEADLVVDASGRGSRAPDWLRSLGRPAPKTTVVDPLLGYASRAYAVPPGFDPGWKALYLQAGAPETKRTGGLFPQENGRWIVSLSGAGGDYGPTGEREFLEFARGLRSPLLYEAIKNAEPLSPIVAFRRTANHRRHYERVPDWPDGFVVVGDAVCAFNPIYGQGMTVAAIQATALGALLAGGDPRRLAPRFQRIAARSGSGAWLIATGEDLRYRETQGSPVRLRTRVINRYVDRVVAAANVDPVACRRLLEVLALSASPYSLFRPAVLARALGPLTPPPAEPPGPLHVDALTTQNDA